jgi:GAF domain-containing protein
VRPVSEPRSELVRRKEGAARIDPDALAASLRRLAKSGDDASVLPALNATVEACVDLFRVTGSGMMLADEQNVLRYVASTDGPGRKLELVEAGYGQGPCTDTFVNNRPIFTADLMTDGRWPDTAAAVVPDGVRAVLGVPLRLGGVPLGSLDVYIDRPHQWDESEQNALVRYSDVIESTLAAALAAERAGTLAAQLQYALDYRVVIERAVGFLMASNGVDAVAAFNRLRTAARNTRRKIGDVSEELLATGRLPG